jgi:hypothetical protein
VQGSPRWVQGLPRPADPTPLSRPGRECGPQRSRSQSSLHRRSTECSCQPSSEPNPRIPTARRRDRPVARRSRSRLLWPLRLSYSASDHPLKEALLWMMSEVVGRRTAPTRRAALACRCPVLAAAASSSLVSMQIGPKAHHGLAERCVSPPFSDSLDRRTVAWQVLSLSGRQAEYQSDPTRRLNQQLTPPSQR